MNDQPQVLIRVIKIFIGLVKPILHYALGSRFGKVCEQKREKNATVLHFYPTYISVI